VGREVCIPEELLAFQKDSAPWSYLMVSVTAVLECETVVSNCRIATLAVRSSGTVHVGAL
jgi:hypothetical protein